MPPESVMKRRQEIISIMETAGSWNVPRRALAEKYGVAEQQIYKDIRRILGEAKSTPMPEVKSVLENGLQLSIKHAQRILVDPTSTKRERLDAARTICIISKDMTQHYESWGDKTPTPILNLNANVNITPQMLLEKFEKE